MDTQKIQGQGQGPTSRGQTLSRPRTGMFDAKAKDIRRKCSPKKKGLQNFFRRSQKIFSRFLACFNKISTLQKIVLSSPEDKAIFEDLRLRGQGQGLQNVSSRPRTSLRTPPLQNEQKTYLLLR